MARFTWFTWVLFSIMLLTTILCWNVLEDDTDIAGLFLLPILGVDLICVPLFAVGALGMRWRKPWAFKLAVRAGAIAGGIVCLFIPLALFVVPFHLMHFDMASKADVRRWHGVKS